MNWRRAHEHLDVWSATALVPGFGELKRWINEEAVRTNDRFVQSYQNIVDPNLSVQFIQTKQLQKPTTEEENGDNMKAVFSDDPDASSCADFLRSRGAPEEGLIEQGFPSAESEDYRWIAVDAKLDKKTRSVHLASPIPRLPRTKNHKNNILYSAVEELLTAAVEPLSLLRNWVKYGHESWNFLDINSREEDDGPLLDEKCQHAISQRRPPLPFSGLKPDFQSMKTVELKQWLTAHDQKEDFDVFIEKQDYVRAANDRWQGGGIVDFQVVVKVQRVVVQPGKSYKGCWHDEGLHEKIIAVLVLYTSIDEEHLQGGEIQFAPKGDIRADFGHDYEIRDAWKKRIKANIPCSTGTAVFFSNYQTVHRVLEITNSSDKEQVREFLCLFIVDPLFRLPTTSNSGLENIDPVLFECLPIKPIVELVLAYLPPEGPVFSLNHSKILRKLIFKDQMKPKQNGTWMLYSTGNGDSKNVGWSTQPLDFDEPPRTGSWLEPLHGTDDDWVPTYQDGDYPHNPNRELRNQLRKSQTASF